MSEDPLYECVCGRVFIRKNNRTNHQRVCNLCDSTDILGEPVKRSPSYRELIEKAATTDPLYAKYKGRKHIAEPNGMSDYFFRYKRGKKSDVKV